MDQIFAYLSRFFMILGGVALLALVLLATGNVGMRIFHVPMSGTYEIVSYLGAIVIASALGHTQRRKDHIVVDILSEKFPAPLKHLLDAVNYTVTALLFGVVAWQLYVLGDSIRLSGETSETLKISFHFFVYIVALGFAMLAFTLLLDFMKTLLQRERSEP